MKPVEMKQGTAISGAMHLGFLALALFGTDWLTGRDSAPLVVTEVELIDGTNFEAALSTAPVVPNEGPAELAPQVENDVEPVDLSSRRSKTMWNRSTSRPRISPSMCPTCRSWLKPRCPWISNLMSPIC
jgi:hypothetical protein